MKGAIVEHRRRVKFPSGRCNKCDAIVDSRNHSLREMNKETFVCCGFCNEVFARLPSDRYYSMKMDFGTWIAETQAALLEIKRKVGGDAK